MMTLHRGRPLDLSGRRSNHSWIIPRPTGRSTVDRADRSVGGRFLAHDLHELLHLEPSCVWDWRARGSRDIRAISDYCLHVSAVRVPDADGFSLGPSQPRPDVADPKSGAAIQRHEGRSFLFPTPPFDGHRRYVPRAGRAGRRRAARRRSADRKRPSHPGRAVAPGRHHTPSGARISVRPINSAMRRRLSAWRWSRKAVTSARSR